ncbi:MAG TPA: PP2C family protein-serine/threonine phosphatase, partial [Thermoleophilia bacterium]|nr:PP2C family protein-serine/threonine phosphatase [Thermoleophilia bacterium]
VLPDGVLWVMTGDVAGHGLDAAVTMSRLRAALRSYALDGNAPDRVLALADRKLQFFDPGKMATVVCGRAPSPYERVELASAGHLPPVSARPGQPATLLDLPPSPPIGVSDERPQTVVAELPTGALLLFYTDGLVERRGEALDVGLDRLTKVVTADNPETVCRTVMAALVGPDTPEDDIAVLALRRRE